MLISVYERVFCTSVSEEEQDMVERDIPLITSYPLQVVVPGSQGIMSVLTQQTDVNMNVASSQTEVEAEDSLLSAVPRMEMDPSSTMVEADSGLSNSSPQSNFSPSPASSVSSFSNDTSSLSDDESSSEEEHLSPPKVIIPSGDTKPR